MDELMQKLEAAIESLAATLRTRAVAQPVAPDAIDAILATPPRAIGVARIRGTPEYQQALDAIADGRIAADGLHQALNLANLLLGLALKAV